MAFLRSAAAQAEVRVPKLRLPDSVSDSANGGGANRHNAKPAPTRLLGKRQATQCSESTCQTFLDFTKGEAGIFGTFALRR